MRAVAEPLEVRKGRTAIVVTEIPYQVSRDRIMEKIATVVREKKITGISDLRDESDRDGTRLVIELKRDAVPKVVLNQLYKLTQLQESFGVNMVALVDGVPRTLSVRDMIAYYLDHQMEVIERRTRFRLRKAEGRAHIVEGLLIALDNIDAVVAAIRASQDTPEARATLVERFELSEEQATHILDMPLRRLTALETTKLRDERAELQRTIDYLNGLLADPGSRRSLIATELIEIKEKFSNPRRSRIIPDEGEMSLEDLIADDELVVTVTANGYIKSVSANVYRHQGRGGRGVRAENMREDDVIDQVLHTTAHAYLLFFTNRGKVYRIRAHELPRKDRTAKGVVAPFRAAASAGRAHRSRRGHSGLRDSSLPGHRHPQRTGEKEPFLGLRQPPEPADRHQAPRGRRGGGGEDHGRQRRSPSVHSGWTGHQVRRDGYPADGSRHDGRARHQAASGRCGRVGRRER